MIRDDSWWPPPHPHTGLGTVSDVPGSLISLTAAHGPPKRYPHPTMITQDDPWWPPPIPTLAWEPSQMFLGPQPTPTVAQGPAGGHHGPPQ